MVFTYIMTKRFTRNSLGFLLNLVLTEKPNKISTYITFEQSPVLQGWFFRDETWGFLLKMKMVL